MPDTRLVLIRLVGPINAFKAKTGALNTRDTPACVRYKLPTVFGSWWLSSLRKWSVQEHRVVLKLRIQWNSEERQEWSLSAAPLLLFDSVLIEHICYVRYIFSFVDRVPTERFSAAVLHSVCSADRFQHLFRSRLISIGAVLVVARRLFLIERLCTSFLGWCRHLIQGYLSVSVFRSMVVVEGYYDTCLVMIAAVVGVSLVTAHHRCLFQYLVAADR